MKYPTIYLLNYVDLIYQIFKKF